MRILIINGPNLNLLGIREPEIYGGKTFENYLHELKKKFPQHQLEYYQTNIEGEIINKLQEAGLAPDMDGIILNAGGYAHTSVAIADAIAPLKNPVIEVHITNPYAREDYRQKNLLAGKCKASIVGFGLRSYELAVRSFED